MPEDQDVPVDVTLLEAVGQYVSNLKAKSDHTTTHTELSRFVQWCGADRALAGISPPEIGDYAEQLGGSTTVQASERLQVVRTFLTYARKKGLIERNLAQHVRIRKAKSRTGRNQAADAKEAVELTPQGHAQLDAELGRLKSERAPLAAEIGRAAADKDVRENTPLEAAREQLGHVESRISEIETMLKVAVIIDPSKRGNGKTVRLGSKVVLKDVDSGREKTYVVVNAYEANSLEGKISDRSPVGKALMSRSAGQEVLGDTPRGTLRDRIVRMSS